MSFSHNGIKTHLLELNSGIIIWYARIPDIIHSVLSKDKTDRLTTPQSQSFQKHDFTKIFLSHEERITINGFKALKKQTEWMSGRYLIKSMIQATFLKRIPLDQITLSYLDQGAPFLPDHADIPVSLSHSNDYTVVACSKNKNQTFGIDIEKIAQKPDNHFLKTAFTQTELTHLKKDAFEIFKHWTLKEAYLKYIKKGFNESLHNVEVINSEIWHNNKKAMVNVMSTGIDSNYILSVVSD